MTIIRRAFLRRMASAAMAGMLGLELVSRVPKVEPVQARTDATADIEGWIRDIKAQPHMLTPDYLVMSHRQAISYLEYLRLAGLS